SSRRRHTRSYGNWSSDVCSSDLLNELKCFFNSAGHRFFNEYVDTPVEQVRRDLKMQVGGHNHCHDIGPRLFHHLAIIAVARYMRSEERRVGKEYRDGWRRERLI